MVNTMLNLTCDFMSATANAMEAVSTASHACVTAYHSISQACCQLNEVCPHLWLKVLVSHSLDPCLAVGALCVTVAAALQPQPVGNLCNVVRNLRLLIRRRPVGNSRVNQVACLACVSELHFKSVII